MKVETRLCAQLYLTQALISMGSQAALVPMDLGCSHTDGKQTNSGSGGTWEWELTGAGDLIHHFSWVR